MLQNMCIRNIYDLVVKHIDLFQVKAIYLYF